MDLGYVSKNWPMPNKVTHPQANIHQTAIIHHEALIAPDVIIGPNTIIGQHVTIDSGTRVGANVLIDGHTKIGKNNQIFASAHIGNLPQDLKFNGEQSFLVIGDDNIIRENVTIGVGTEHGGNITRIGNHNLFMIGCHIAHDAQIGHHNVIANQVQIGGHVYIGDWVTIGGLAGIHQFCHIGSMAMIGFSSKITKNILPFSLVDGNPASLYGINIERLRRLKYTNPKKNIIKRAFEVISNLKLTAMPLQKQLEQEFSNELDILKILKFISTSQGNGRGYYRSKQEK